MRILIAVDDSAGSEAVLKLGAQFLRASRFGEAPTILTVVADKANRLHAEQMLAEQRNLLAEGAEHLRSKVRIGHPVNEIVKETAEERYDLLVIGLKPEESLWDRWRGSTTMQLIEQVDCAVALAKGPIRPLRRILLCDSGGQSSALVNHFISSLGSLLSQELSITVLHVMSQISAGPQAKGDDLHADADTLIRARTPEGQWLAQDLKLLENSQVRSTPKVRHGFVVDEVLAEATAGDYDLVAIGAHQRSGWTGLLSDNLARQITTQIDRPMLLVR